jgi:RNA-directed DNA polymerase
MTTRREKSDGRIVPEGRRKPVPTAAKRGGRATTASEQAAQRMLFPDTADSPKGAATRTGTGLPVRGGHAAPKSRNTSGTKLPAMTMEEVASDENLIRAFAEVARNRGAPGPDGQSIDDVRERISELMPVLRCGLLEGTYRPGMIRRVWIPKPGGVGERGLGIPDVVDRWIQQAVHQVLSPHWEPTFHPSSHGFRPGRSCHTAIAEAKTHMAAGFEWVVDLDLEKFFDRVHWQRLVSRLEMKVKDRRLIDLVWQMLKAKVVMPDGVVTSTEEGVPQGGPLSPLLSNIVLDELDQELARRGHRFVRYADDENIYVRSERAGHRVMASVVRFIEGRMRLKVNQTKSAVARPKDRHFVGFRLRKEKRSGRIEVLPSMRSRDRLAGKIRELTPRALGQSVIGCIKRLNAYMLGWMNFFGPVCTRATVTFLQTTDAHVRRRLRAILLRQWKRKRFIVRRLRRMGAGASAGASIYRGHRSLWALSHCKPVDEALSPAYFARQGLVSLEDSYRTMHTVTASAQLELRLRPLRAPRADGGIRGLSSPDPTVPKSRM